MRGLALSAVAGSVAAALLSPGLAAPPKPSSVPDSPAAVTAPGAALPAPAAPRLVLPVGPLDPGSYATGGCVAFGPTAGQRDRTVFLDAGHGGRDPGTVGVTAQGQPVPEKDLTLSVALETAQELRARGYRVALSRTTDDIGVPATRDGTDTGALDVADQRAQLSARARCANLADAAALISIHFNSFTDPQVRGAETLYEPDRPFAEDNRRLATLLQRSIVRGYGEAGQPTPDRGTVGGPGAGEQTSSGDLIILGPSDGVNVVEPSAMPGALIEPAFLTNPTDTALATSPAGRRTVARAITLGVDEFLQRP